MSQNINETTRHSKFRYISFKFRYVRYADFRLSQISYLHIHRICKVFSLDVFKFTVNQ